MTCLRPKWVKMTEVILTRSVILTSIWVQNDLARTKMSNFVSKWVIPPNDPGHIDSKWVKNESKMTPPQNESKKDSNMSRRCQNDFVILTSFHGEPLKYDVKKVPITDLWPQNDVIMASPTLPKNQCFLIFSVTGWERACTDEFMSGNNDSLMFFG